jgi:GNAT superfamily N-acetyltransferase
MSWELTEDVEAFASTAGDFLRSRPVEHTVFLTLVDTLRRRGLHAYGPGDPIFGWWRRPDGMVEGALLQTPPHPVMFSRLAADAVPAAIPVLRDRPLPGINMLAGDAEVFLPRWAAPATVARRTRLYRLGTFEPSTAAGTPRQASPSDRDLLLRWHRDFYDEIGEGHQDDFGPAVDDRIGYGGVTLWEADGSPVSMAIRSRLESDMIRIQLVYTPRSDRGRGYAGAATSVATQQALDLGATFVVLVTDLANPTSNGLYQRLGYRPIEDRVVVEFPS